MSTKIRSKSWAKRRNIKKLRQALKSSSIKRMGVMRLGHIYYSDGIDKGMLRDDRDSEPQD